MKNSRIENIQVIILGILRGQSQSSIGDSLGLHRQTVSKVMGSPGFQSTVDILEKFLMNHLVDDERKKKNGVILKAIQMSHLDKADILKTAQQLARQYYSDPGEYLSVVMEDVDDFCEAFHIII